MSAQWNEADIHKAVQTAQILTQYADRVVISGPIPEYDLALPRLLALAETGRETYQDIASHYHRAEQHNVDTIFSQVTLPERVTYVSVYKALCNPDCIKVVDNGTPLQFDYGHLTAEGSRYLAQLVGARARGIVPSAVQPDEAPATPSDDPNQQRGSAPQPASPIAAGEAN